MFTLPENLPGLSREEIDTLFAAAQVHARSVIESSPNDVDALTSARGAFQAVTAERNTRIAAEGAASELASLLSDAEIDETEDDAETVEDEVEAVKAPEPVLASRKTVRKSTIDVPAPTPESQDVVMVAAPDVPGFSAGAVLPNFAAAGEALLSRLQGYSIPARPYRGDGRGRVSSRHGGVIFRRQFPEALRIQNGQDAWAIVRKAAQESRLPGGSLVESAKQQIANGRAITAAVGWCAPSEVLYALCDLTSIDGLLDLPEIQAARGGFQLPADGGPDFSILWNGLGNDGDVVLTEYDVESSTPKVCFEIPCPDFTDVRMDVAYVCLTASLLQSRGYPEVIEWFAREAMKALPHKVNQSVIAKIVAASGAATVVPADASGDDAASALLSAVDLAIEDTKYRQRMARGASLEVVLPFWAITQIRAALSRRYGVALLAVDDAMILGWFAIRNAVPRFVYDWQDAYTGLVGGPGGATPLTALPTTVQFLIYPAGTWAKIVRDVVNLDTVYDNALLTQNQYTGLFTEEGFNVIQLCPESRLYTASVDPSGVVGCCPVIT